MAVDPLNLIQVQSRLQNPASVTNQDLLKYANGSNPEVPSFLALIEMNRRKQIEDTSAAFDASAKPSIKEQIAQGLTGAGQMMQVNPTTAPVGIVNPTNMQQPAQPTVAPPVMDMSAAPQGIDPTQMQAPVQAARGGLMSLPTRHFHSSNFAGGGIVAFGDPALNPNEDQVVADRDADQASLVAAAQRLPKYYNPQTTQQALAQSGQTLQDEAAAAAARPAAPAPPSATYESVLAGLPSLAKVPMEKPEALTPENAFAAIKRTQKLAGVSEDPYAEVKKREAAIEKRQLEEYERGGIDRLLAQAAAFATADPSKGFGYAAAVSSVASRALEKEQNALRDKQENAALEFQKSMAKEEDAKARGDASAITSAVEQRKKDEVKYAELVQQNQKIETDRQQLAATIYHYQTSAENTKEQNRIMDAYHQGQLTLQEAQNQVEKLKSDAMAGHYKDQASYNAGYLKYLNRTQDIAEQTKPSAEDKKLATVEARVNSDPTIKALAESLKPINGMDPGSEEYYNTLTRIRESAIPYYKAAKLPPPPEVARVAPLPPKAAKKGLFESIFGSSVPPAPTSKAVPFDQLPDK